MEREIIRKDCFWYRPWQDMSATFDQCELANTAECLCKEDCKWYISKDKADDLIYAILQLWAELRDWY